MGRMPPARHRAPATVVALAALVLPSLGCSGAAPGATPTPATAASSAGSAAPAPGSATTSGGPTTDQAGTSTSAGGEVTGGATAPGSTVSGPGETTMPPMRDPETATPDPRVVDLVEHRLDRAVATGKEVRISWTATGRPECSRLGRVDVIETPATVSVILLIGRDPLATCAGPQIQDARPMITTIRLYDAIGSRTVKDAATPG